MKSKTPVSIDGLDVVRLTRAEWRVSDDSEPHALLGYIERQRAGRFEVVWMTDPMRWGYAASFEEALLAFGDSSRFTGEILTQRAEELDSHSHERAETAPRSHLPRRSTWVKSNGSSSVA